MGLLHRTLAQVVGDIFKWRQCFDKYDTGGSGELSTTELYKLVEEVWNDKYGSDASSTCLTMIQFMVDEADLDGSGEISWWEFVTMMQVQMPLALKC